MIMRVFVRIPTYRHNFGAVKAGKIRVLQQVRSAVGKPVAVTHVAVRYGK